MNVMWCRGCRLYYWTKAKKVYLQLITNNKIFNLSQNISQRKSRFYTKIMLFLKLSLLHVHLRGDDNIIAVTAVVDVLTVYLRNVSLIGRYISLLFNFNNFYYYNFGSLIEDFLQCYKIENNFLLRFWWFNTTKDFYQYRRNLTNYALRLI